MSPREQAIAAFQMVFGEDPAHTVQAPGRVNLIGEHTDYNDGFVLPAAIDFGTVVAGSLRDDTKVHLVAANYGNDEVIFAIDKPIEPTREPLWANYIKGVFHGLAASGQTLRGVNLAICGNVPQGAGLSSSASLEVAIGEACRVLMELDVARQEIALIGQEAEHDFVGTKCGIMDQLISALGVAGHALLIDCRTLETEPVSMPAGLSIVIINSNVRRGLVESEYNERRASCEKAARLLGIAALRDISLTELEANLDTLPAAVARRARHVVTENERTLAAAEALGSGDLKSLSTLMAASHASMRDDFEITVPPIDLIVETVSSVLGQDGGVRMTGGGFGGCVVALAPEDAVPDIRSALKSNYESRTGLAEDVWVCEASAGAGPLGDEA